VCEDHVHKITYGGHVVNVHTYVECNWSAEMVPSACDLQQGCQICLGPNIPELEKHTK
jgi:hypothetical protein